MNPKQGHHNTTGKRKVEVYLHGDMSSGSSKQGRLTSSGRQKLVPSRALAALQGRGRNCSL